MSNPSSYQVGYFAGSAFRDVFLIPLVVAWVAWLIFRRSYWVSNFVFCLVTCAIGYVTWDKAQHMEAGMQQMDQAQQELTSNIRKAMKDPATAPAVAQQQIDRFSQQLGSATSEMQGKDKLVGQAGQRFFKLLGVEMQKYTTAYQALVQAGFVQAKGINTLDDLHHRRELVKDFADANESVAAFYRSAEDTFRTELKKEDLTDDYVESVLKGFEKTASIDLVLKVRACDAELVEQANKILDDYEQQWGKWHLDDSGKIIFENSSAVTDFNSAQGTIREIADKQKGIQEQIFQNTGSAGKPQ